MEGRKLLTLTSALSLLVPPGQVLGAVRNFKPTIVYSFGDAQLVVEHEQNKHTGDDQTKTDSHDTVFRELLNLGLEGYSYDPRLMTFLAKGSIGLEQERLKQINDPAAKSYDDSIEEYELRGFFLPTHPYNLELYTLQSRPLLTSGYSSRDIDKRSNSGAIARYDKERWHNRFQYDHTDITGANSEVTDLYTASTAYSNDFSNLYGSYWFSDRTDNRFSNETKTSRTDLGYTLFKRENASLLSHVTLGRTDGTTSDNKNSDWQERLELALPYNFSSDLAFNRRRRDDSFFFNNSTTNQYENTDSYEFTLRHQLFDSLRSRYTFLIDDTDQTSGDLRRNRNLLDLDYKKNVPTGILFASFNLDDTTLDRKKPASRTATTVVQETDPNDPYIIAQADLADPDVTIALQNQGVDQDTITVYVLDDDAGKTPVLLIKDINYRLRLISSTLLTYEIEIISLLGVPGLPTTNDEYLFRITYDVLPVQYVLDTFDTKYSLRLSLFDNFFIPYYTFRRKTQEVTDGFFPSGNLEPVIKENLLGLTLNKYGLTLGSEYDDIRAKYDSEEKLSHFARYTTEFTYSPLTVAHLNLEGLRTRYIHRKRGGVEQDFPTIYEFRAEVGTSTRVVKTNGTLSVTAAYESRSDVLESSELVETADGALIVTQQVSETFSEDVITGDVRYVMVIPNTAIRTDLDALYQRRRSLNESELYRFTGNLNWQIGATRIELRGKYETKDQTSTNNLTATDEEILFYLNIVRKLF